MLGATAVLNLSVHLRGLHVASAPIGAIAETALALFITQAMTLLKLLDCDIRTVILMLTVINYRPRWFSGLGVRLEIDRCGVQSSAESHPSL